MFLIWQNSVQAHLTIRLNSCQLNEQRVVEDQKNLDMSQKRNAVSTCMTPRFFFEL